MLLQHTLELRDIGEVTVSLLRNRDTFVAFSIGSAEVDTTVRVQSRCAYGEVFGSVDCDCKDQLDRAWQVIKARKCGIVVYGDQEGRGAGLWAKARAYEMRDTEGLDTFTAYLQQGLSRDLRDYSEASRLLAALGVSSIRLLSNNPDKIASLEASGLTVTREPLITTPHVRAEHYLETKRDHGHLT